MRAEYFLCVLTVLICVSIQTDCSSYQTAVSIQPADKTYWSDSEIRLTCKPRNSIQTEDCFWFVNSKRINTSDSSYEINPHSCSITTKVASIAVSGEWKCKLFPAGEGRAPISASTRITVLRLTFREFVVLFVCLVILVASLAVIALLLLKVRRLSESLTTLSGRNGQFLVSPGGQAAEDCASCTTVTPPPSYNTVIGERILAGECARMEYARFLSEIIPSAPCSSEFNPLPRVTQLTSENCR